MRGITLPMVAVLSLLAAAAPAQQPPAATGDTIGHPPPIPGPPPISDQRRSLHQPIRRRGQANRLPKATPALTRPPVHRQPHTPQVHCRSRIRVRG